MAAISGVALIIALRFILFLESEDPRRWWGVAVSIEAESPCRDAVNSGSCARAIESRQLSKMKGGASRAGRRLTLRLAGGVEKPFEDSAPGAGADDVIAYSLIDMIPQLDSYLLFVQHWEGGNSLLVRRSDGQTLTLDRAPVLSPTGAHFITVCASIAYDPNAVRIYRVTREKPVLEWAIEPREWGPGVPRWIGPDAVVVPTDGLVNEIERPANVPTSITIRCVSGKWVLAGSK